MGRKGTVVGLGRYQSGEFHLVASLRHPADQGRIDEWRPCFVHASRLLFEATNGQHWIATVTFCNDSTGGRIADLWLEEPDGRAISGHGGSGRPGIFGSCGAMSAASPSWPCMSWATFCTTCTTSTSPHRHWEPPA